MLEVNLPAARLWLACQTQWRIGFAGATGLDYTALFGVAAAQGLTVDGTMLRKVQLLEGMTLQHWAKERK